MCLNIKRLKMMEIAGRFDRTICTYMGCRQWSLSFSSAFGDLGVHAVASSSQCAKNCKRN